jgi:YVTN family beta-propeller protein
MRFAVLGPLEVSLDQGPLSLGGRKQRTLLAVLLLHANEIVPRDELTDALWGERVPPSAAESLDAYVYRLRKLLGHDRLLRARGGYVLRVEAGERDIDAFEGLAARAGHAAAAGDQETAVDALNQALALWRGPAWVDVLDLPPANTDARRLEELRLGALESRIEAELATGAGAELVAEMEQLVSEHPLRERLVFSLMLALYRAGRHADALEVFGVARGRLIDELGLEPGPGLRELHQQILEHDPSLGAPRLFLPARGSRRRSTLAAAAVLAVAAIVVGFLLSAGAASPQQRLGQGASGVVAVNAAADRVSLATRLPGSASAVTSGAGSVWVTDSGDGTVSRIDQSSGALVDRIPVGGDPTSIASGAGSIWIADTDGATVLRINPTTESVTQRIRLDGANPDALAFAAGRLWVADSSTRAIYKLDPATGAVLQTIALNVAPSAIAFGTGALWVAGYDSGVVLKLGARSGHPMASVRVGTGPASLTFADGNLWVANSLDSTVSRVDPVSLSVRATIPVGSGPSAVVADDGSVWVANEYSGSVSRIDPRRSAVVATAAIGGKPTSLTVDGARLWAGADANGQSHRGGTLALASVLRFPSVDPALYDNAGPAQFGGLAYDTLVTFDHTGGVEGLRLVPDLALTLPTPTDGERTYTFRLRPGIRYSNGAPLRAGDFRRAIERLFRVGSPGTSFYTAIVGAAACTRRPARCDFSRGIVTDDVTGSVVFHLTAPDPEFLEELTQQDYTAPVPLHTPERNMGLNPVPGTGPYMISRADRTGVYFTRNPFFREWSHAAQPNGSPNTITWRYEPSQPAAATAVQDGRADWLWGLVPPAEYRQVAIESPSQLHSNAQFAVDFFPLNTHLPPFNNVLVRRAFNYAIDRNAIAHMYGGAAFATPACQPLAPGLPGYRHYCPYTSHPNEHGTYTGPHMSYAKRLVARSGTRGEHIDVWGSPDEGYIPAGIANYAAHVLRSLGYRATLHVRSIASISNAMYRRVQMNTNGDWLAPYPDPSSYIPAFFSCGGGNSSDYVCDPVLDREMEKAESLESSDPAAANSLWTSIDHTFTDQADWVPTENLREVDLVSRRLGHYEFNPVWGFLADQSWVQ